MNWNRIWKWLCILTCGGMVLQTTGCETTADTLIAELLSSVVMSAVLGGLGT